MRQDLTVAQRILRSMGLTVMLMTAVACALLAVSLASGETVQGWRQPLVVLSLILAAVAALTMTIDSFDLWMLGRRVSTFSVRMLHSLVFVATLAAIVMSLITRTPGLLLVTAPALVIYLFTVMKPQPRAGARAESRSRGRAAGRAQPRSGRQKRGGKKRT